MANNDSLREQLALPVPAHPLTSADALRLDGARKILVRPGVVLVDTRRAA